MRTLLFVSALALAACAGDSADSGVPASIPGQTADADVVACDVLTAPMVAASLDVPEGSLGPPESDEVMGIKVCSYKVVGEGDYNSVSLGIQTYNDARAAESQFSLSYKTQTDEDLAAIEAEADRATRQMEAEGRADALEGIDAGEMLSGMVSKFSYEALPGLGDQAAFETNNLTDPPGGGLYIRDGALVYTVSIGPDQQFYLQDGTFDVMRERMIDLGRRIMDAR